MPCRRSLLLLLLAAAWWGPAAPLRAEPPASRRTAVVQAAAAARAAVVNIQSERLAQADAPPADLQASSKANGMGTGILIDPRGYLITNFHVIEDVSALRARLSDGSNYAAKVVARDKEHDLALLKIEADQPLPTIRLGTSSDLMIGETVIAIGNAFGYEHTVTVGVISALNRDVTLNKEVAYKALIQTDASINPGNSGGPLLNVDGELIGVNVAIRAGAQGIGFAIPVDQVVQVAGGLLAKRRSNGIAPGLLCRDRVTPGQTPCRCLEVEGVDPNGSAAQAGLQRGDVVVALGGTEVRSTMDLERALLDAKPGDKLPVRVRRGGAEQQCELVLATPRAPSPPELVWKQLGVRLAVAAHEQIARGGTTLRGGMTVTELAPDSPAARAGIQVGDVLVGLHQWETLNLDNVLYVLKHQDLATFYPLRFYVLREGQIHKGFIQGE